MLRAKPGGIITGSVAGRCAMQGRTPRRDHRKGIAMLPEIDFGKLVTAMFDDDRSWRDLDNQIRTMNKKLAQWRRARLDRGATYTLTQRTAFEVLVAMQAIYCTVEKPPVRRPAIEHAGPPEPAADPMDGQLWVYEDGALVAAVFGQGGHEVVAAPAGGVAGTLIEVSAAA